MNIEGALIFVAVMVGVIFFIWGISPKQKPEPKLERKYKQMKVKIVDETGRHHVLTKKPTFMHTEYGTFVSEPSPSSFIEKNQHFVKVDEKTYLPRERIISIDFEMEDYNEST